jgi:hypothetical protein
LFLIKSVSNFRDASIGSKMKNNVLFRCAKLSTLSNTDIHKLEEINLHAIIDFRDPKEIKKAPDNLPSKVFENWPSISFK